MEVSKKRLTDVFLSRPEMLKLGVPEERLVVPRAAFEGGEDIFVSSTGPLALALTIQLLCPKQKH